MPPPAGEYRSRVCVLSRRRSRLGRRCHRRRRSRGRGAPVPCEQLRAPPSASPRQTRGSWSSTTLRSAVSGSPHGDAGWFAKPPTAAGHRFDVAEREGAARSVRDLPRSSPPKPYCGVPDKDTCRLSPTGRPPLRTASWRLNTNARPRTCEPFADVQVCKVRLEGVGAAAACGGGGRVSPTSADESGQRTQAWSMRNPICGFQV